MFKKLALLTIAFSLVGTALVIYGYSENELIDAHEVNLVVLDFSQEVEGSKGGTAFDIARK